jgi:hypothetical protein
MILRVAEIGDIMHIADACTSQPLSVPQVMVRICSERSAGRVEADQISLKRTACNIQDVIPVLPSKQHAGSNNAYAMVLESDSSESSSLSPTVSVAAL